MTTHGRRMRASLALAVAAAVATFGMAACGGDENADLPEPASPRPPAPEAPAVTLTAEEQQAVDEVRAIFDEFMTAYVEILTAGNTPTDAELEPFLRLLTDPLLHETTEVYDNYQNERRADGQVEWQFVEVVEVDLDNVEVVVGEDEAIPLVRLRYCVDGTEWRTVEKSTGEPAEPAEQRVVDPGQRNHVTVEAAHFDLSPVGPRDDPRWHLADWQSEESQPC